jgi:nucleotide-binding universal stress UspA family protein
MRARDVLFATDFSAASEEAARVAREMARQWGARLHVVHVVPPVTDPGWGADQLKRLAGPPAEGIQIETALLSGRPARAILSYARDKGVGLIVLGTHGRTGVSRAMLGSVAESVVRMAHCPVLTVPGPGGAPAPAAAAAEAAAAHRCIVCARETEELVCEPCRARIRGEALERKIEAERAGRRGSSV